MCSLSFYKSQRNTWMNSEIFAEWFKKDFIPAVKCTQTFVHLKLCCWWTTVLLKELKTRDGSVTCMFLPPNTTSLIQPTDQGVLHAMKIRYKRKLLQKVICGQNLDPTQNITEMVKQHTVKDALASTYWLMRGKKEALIEYLRHTISSKFIPIYRQMVLNQNRRTFPPNL